MEISMTKIASVLAMAMAIIASITAGAHAHQLPDGFKGFDDPANCGACHDAIYSEWEGSMHAKSSKFGDPLHAAVADAFAGAMAAKGGKGNYFCANCHAPAADNMAALMKGEAAPDPENVTNTRGVTCSFCHMVDGVVQGEKFHTYEVTDGIKGAVADVKAPHATARWSFEDAYDMCLGCHGKLVSGKGGVVCSMEDEGISDCLSCHMETVDGPPAKGSKKAAHAYHGMFGAHDPGMLKKGASVSLAVEGGTLKVTLANPNPHYFPSTNPLRMAFVKFTVLGADGSVMYKNFQNSPEEDPQAMLIKVFKAGGEVGVPSWEAEGVARDTRLKPGETRVLTYSIPDGAAKVKAGLYYRFVPPKAMDKFGIRPDGTVEKPQPVSEAEITL